MTHATPGTPQWADELFTNTKFFIQGLVEKAKFIVERAIRPDLEVIQKGPSSTDEARAVNSRIETNFNTLQSYLASIRSAVATLRAQGIITEDGARTLFEAHDTLMSLLRTLSQAHVDLTTSRSLGTLASAILSLGKMAAEFSRVSGLTAALENAWREVKGLVEPIAQGTRQALASTGTLLSWLPWLALGAGVIFVAPYLLPGVTRIFKSNPPKRSVRRRNWMPLLLLGGVTGAGVAYYLSTREKTIPTRSASGVMAAVMAPQEIQMTVGTVKLAGTLAAARVELAKAGIPSTVRDLGQVYEILVPVDKADRARVIVDRVRADYRESVITV